MSSINEWPVSLNPFVKLERLDLDRNSLINSVPSSGMSSKRSSSETGSEVDQITSSNSNLKNGGMAGRIGSNKYGKCPPKSYNSGEPYTNHSLHDLTSEERKGLTCPICNTAFVKSKSLSRHTNRKPVKCGDCSQVFCTPWKLSKHKSSHETFVCSICGKGVQKGDKLAHRKEHRVVKGKLYNCDICQASFEVSTILELHLRSHTGKKPFQCKICKKKFSQSSNLKTHQKVHQVPTDMFQCSICFIKIKSRVGFMRHEMTCGDKVDAYFLSYKVPISPEKLKPRARTTTKTLYKCKSCEERFNRRDYAILHTFRHHLKLKLYTCNYCDAKFVDRTELQTHTRSHTDEKPFKCPHCPREFRQSTHQLGHVRAIHSQETNYACSHCGKKFKTVGVLRSHLLVHTKETPYKCPECPQQFARSANLRRHLNNHRGIRNYKCPINKCGKGFLTKPELSLHGISHSDIRPFPCTICDVAFKINGKLKEHCRSKQHRDNALQDSPKR